MARIQQLSKHLINQIAAGEVIERPASVVKELTENSIDAGASKISIEISNDCRNIRVADNGSGIHPDDILLAFSKHATSKIQSDEDLFNIHTLGFRGEALSSIISISKLTCTTRTKDFDTGTKVKCENSEVKQVETGCAVGTIMDIKDLFYNIPARLKFLRNPNTEFSYIQAGAGRCGFQCVPQERAVAFRAGRIPYPQKPGPRQEYLLRQEFPGPAPRALRRWFRRSRSPRTYF